MLKTGDVLIFKGNGNALFVKAVVHGRIVLATARNKEVIRSIGQYLKMKNSFEVISQGDILKKSILYYCPKKDAMIEVPKGSVYLGEI